MNGNNPTAESPGTASGEIASDELAEKPKEPQVVEAEMSFDEIEAALRERFKVVVPVSREKNAVFYGVCLTPEQDDQAEALIRAVVPVEVEDPATGKLRFNVDDPDYIARRQRAVEQARALRLYFAYEIIRKRFEKDFKSGGVVKLAEELRKCWTTDLLSLLDGRIAGASAIDMSRVNFI